MYVVSHSQELWQPSNRNSLRSNLRTLARRTPPRIVVSEDLFLQVVGDAVLQIGRNSSAGVAVHARECERESLEGVER